MKTYKRNPQNSKKSQNRTPNNKLQKDNKNKQQLIGDHNFAFIVLAIILNKYILGRKRKKNKTSRGQLEIQFLWFILQGQKNKNKNKNTLSCNFLLFITFLVFYDCLVFSSPIISNFPFMVSSAIVCVIPVWTVFLILSGTECTFGSRGN